MLTTCLLAILVSSVSAQIDNVPQPGASNFVSVLDQGALAQVEQAYGIVIRKQFELCGYQTNLTLCNINGLLIDVANAGIGLRSVMANPGKDLRIPATWCNEWRFATGERVSSMADQCGALFAWEDGCRLLPSMFEDLAQDPLNDIAVMCNIIAPPSFSRPCEGDHRFKNADELEIELDLMAEAPNKTCSGVVNAMISNTITLTGCLDMPRDECINHFCDFYQEFYSRIRPWNRQEPGSRPRYSYDFILPGCEHPAQFNFDRQTCPQRSDIQGFCDCLCQKKDEGPFAPVRRNALVAIDANPNSDIDCIENINAYLLFGRLGVHGIGLNQECEPYLCEMFDERRGVAECQAFDFPPEEECNSMGLARINQLGLYNCPWEKDSGQEGMMYCLDGTTCVSESLPDSHGGEHWSCCFDKGSIGRGRCPANRPIMCDYLCSGETEFCCRGGYLPESPREVELIKARRFRFWDTLKTWEQASLSAEVQGDTVEGAPCVPLLIPPLGIENGVQVDGKWERPELGWNWAVCPYNLGTKCPLTGRCPRWHGDPTSVTCDAGDCVCLPGYCAVEQLCVPKLLPPASDAEPTPWPSFLRATGTTTTTSVTANMYPTERPTMEPSTPPTEPPTAFPTPRPTLPTPEPTIKPTPMPTPSRRRRRRRRATDEPTPSPTRKPTFDGDRRRRRDRRRNVVVVTPEPTEPTAAPPPSLAPTPYPPIIALEAYDRRRRVDISDNECDLRKCTPVLRDYPIYYEAISNTTTTDSPPGAGAAGDKGFFDIYLFDPIAEIPFDLKTIVLIWLFIAVPCCCSLCVICNLRRVRTFQEDYIDPPLPKDDPMMPIEHNLDKLGSFHVIKKPAPLHDPPPKKRNCHRIVVREMPEKRPLGLELQETLVIRVHPWGEKWGWKEGDLIIQIGGVEVLNFEELWKQIQDQKENMPITFMVERLGENAVSWDARNVANPGPPPSKKKIRQSRQNSKVAPSTGAFSQTEQSRMGTMSPDGNATRAGTLSVAPSRMGTMSPKGNSRMPTDSPTSSRQASRSEGGFAASQILAIRAAAADNIYATEEDHEALAHFEAKEDDGVLPERAYEMEEGTMCTVCRVPIFTYAPSVVVHGDVFHPQCFCCSECRLPIDGKYLLNEEGPGYLCMECRPRCHNCKESVTGRRSLQVDGVRYHVECFICCDCRNLLRVGEFSKVSPGIYQCMICDARDTALENDTEIPEWAKPQIEDDDMPGMRSGIASFGKSAQPALQSSLYGAGQMSWSQAKIAQDPRGFKPGSREGSGHGSKPGSPDLRRLGQARNEPDWVNRLAQPPRINTAFPQKQGLKDLLVKQKIKQGLKPEVRWKKDAWGREVAVHE